MALDMSFQLIKGHNAFVQEPYDLPLLFEGRQSERNLAELASLNPLRGRTRSQGPKRHLRCITHEPVLEEEIVQYACFPAEFDNALCKRDIDSVHVSNFAERGLGSKEDVANLWPPPSHYLFVFIMPDEFRACIVVKATVANVASRDKRYALRHFFRGSSAIVNNRLKVLREPSKMPVDRNAGHKTIPSRSLQPVSQIAKAHRRYRGIRELDEKL